MSGESPELESTLELLCAPKKLNREKGEEILSHLSLSEAEVSYVSEWIIDKLEGLSNWEDVYGGLIAAIILIRNFSYEFLMKINLIPQLETQVLECHENMEFRVRIAAGQLMGLLCGKSGLPLFLKYLPIVLGGVTTNLERNIPAPNSEAELSLQELNLAKERDVNSSRSTLSIFHNTAGWKNLETWMKCLQEIVNNLSADDFEKVNRSEVLKLIFVAVKHINRFVRETGFDVLTTMISKHGCYDSPDSSDKPNYITIAEHIADGMSDNWSQVRMAASRAVRMYFEVSPPPGYKREDVYHILLPVMCLNRYYVAEGVRIYSQDTWCRVTQGEGRKLLGQYIEPALNYYVEQSDADNHAVREAACASMAEAVTKLDPEILRPFIKLLLETLVVCFGDESWPVRDAACVSLGSLISLFPSETREAGYKDLMAEYFVRNLCDSIPSVRDGAAHSIALILKSANDPNLLKFYYNYIQSKLEGITKQPAESHGSESHRVRGRGPGASYVTVHAGNAAHDERHTNQLMYSCCSLAPKLQKGRKGGGCHDGLNDRPSEPWEEADGAIRLIGQLAEISPNLFEDFLVAQMLDASSRRHYTHYPYLLETACDVIVQLCRGLGKAQFRKHLDDLLCIIAAAHESKLHLAMDAASQALKILSNLIGPNVLRARIENHMDSYVTRLVDQLPPIP